MDESGPVADLHVHTTASDGQLTVETVPRAARAADVSVVAVTDHDRIHPELRAPVIERDGVTVVRGVEIRVDAGAAGKVDLLGYGVERTDALEAELDRVQTDRVERAERMVACVQSRLGVSLDLPIEHGVGRPHVARAIADSEADYDYDDAFAHLIGGDGPCYVAREVPSFERAVRLLRGSCALVGLAHPLRYRDVGGALSLLSHLDAVERHYPYGREVPAAENTRLDAAIEEHDLVPTGGSDAHDEQLGVAGLDDAGWARVAEQLPLPETES